ncbi:hypothetical protein EDD96_0923 [Streptomyces sp. Ag109_G2-6]|uniref:DUF5995 family protein n=1 Tax=Streptomyces sp. Ag109_G2-6 TaxID=2485154 RepID=UPI000F50B37B|nr:DUF5995 family protein [Streptomyces sp. Ag109_G2-6]RPF44399.1 hypothetical protein EDD96_0923 [Streptomyces sp. Ag109_G2-6]
MTAESMLPAEKVTRVAGLLAERVRQYDTTHDRRAAFAYTYYRLTTTLATALDTGTPAFTDPPWVAELCETLASAYFAAMDGIDTWLAGRPGGSADEVRPGDLPDLVPPPWRDVFAASSVRRSYTLEDVLFSMMAHISYDLPGALRRMATSTGDRSHIADFHRMNDVLGSCIDRVQDDLSSRYIYGLRSLDRLFTRSDELLTNYGIRVARGLAWFNCDRLLDPDATEEASRSIGRSTGALISEIRSPGDWKLRAGLWILRRLIPERRHWPAASTPLA